MLEVTAGYLLRLHQLIPEDRHLLNLEFVVSVVLSGHQAPEFCLSLCPRMRIDATVMSVCYMGLGSNSSPHSYMILLYPISHLLTP